MVASPGGDGGLYNYMVNLDEIDREIADWQSKLAAARDNLFALYDHPTYKRITGASTFLTGMTASLVTPALTAMSELFAQMDSLTVIVEKAAKIRQSAGHFPWSDRAEKEIKSLLQGPSIQLPPVTTPLDQRGLLTSAEQAQAITPLRMLDVMMKAFDEAKSAVLKVDAAWSRLDPVLGAYAVKLDTLSAMASILGDDATGQVAVAQRQLDALRGIVRTDPLSAARGSSQMEVLLEGLRARLATLDQGMSDLNSRLEAAKTSLAEIADARLRSYAAVAKCMQCLERPAGLMGSLSDAQVDELTSWLSTLSECKPLGRWTALAMGLDRWEQLAAEYRTVQMAAVSANEGKLELLAELRGRLSALKVKALKRGLTGDPGVASAERLASGCLGRVHTPLEDAARLVAEYENLLNAGCN